MRLKFYFIIKIILYFILPIILLFFANVDIFKIKHEKYINYVSLKKINNKIPISENLLSGNVYTQKIPGTMIAQKNVDNLNFESSFCISVLLATYEKLLDKKNVDLELTLSKSKKKFIGKHSGKIQDNKFRKFCYPGLKLKLLNDDFEIKLFSKQNSKQSGLSTYFRNKNNKKGKDLGWGVTYHNNKEILDKNLLIRLIHFQKYEKKKKYSFLFLSLVFILIYLISVLLYFNDRKKKF